MVKFDVISGFLGAGKTTLIKKILSTCAVGHEKIVLIENEFGDVDIDSEILRVAGFDVYELDRGCVCCTLKAEFAVTLEQILSQQPDRIIFEPSGIFILSEIFDLFRHAEIAESCVLNSVTTVIDGLNFFKHQASFSRFLEDQIIKASALIISKTQFLAEEEIEQICQGLRQINESAEIFSEPWDKLSPEKFMLLLDGNTRYALSNVCCHEQEHAHLHRHGFESFGMYISKNIDVNELDSILKELSTGAFGSILRGKGIVQSGQNCLEFSYVDGKYSITKSKSPVSGIASFIGTSLKRDKLARALS